MATLRQPSFYTGKKALVADSNYSDITASIFTGKRNRYAKHGYVDFSKTAQPYDSGSGAITWGA
jgi:hypothetical protein